MANTTISCAGYLEHYHESWTKLQKLGLGAHDLIIFPAWSTTFELVDRTCHHAATLLKMWAFLDREDVWFELVESRKSIDLTPGWLEQLTQDRASWKDALQTLCKYGFIEEDQCVGNQNAPNSSAGERGYNMHGCVHEWSMLVLNDRLDTQMLMMKTALESLVVFSMTETTANAAARTRRTARHVARLHSWITRTELDWSNSPWLLPPVRKMLYLADDPKSYRDILELGAVAARKTQFSERDLHYQSVGSRIQGLWSMAICDNTSAYVREATLALCATERVEGESDGLRIGLGLALSSIQLQQNKPDAAEQTMKRVLRGKEKEVIRLLEEDPNALKRHKHEDVLDAMVQLGMVYAARREFDKASSLIFPATRCYERFFDPAAFGRNLGAVTARYQQAFLEEVAGHTETAESLYTQVLPQWEHVRVPGAMPGGWTIRWRLLFVKKTLGKLDEADELGNQIVEELETEPERDNVQSWGAFWDFAAVKWMRGELDRAEELFVQVLTNLERLLGKENESFQSALEQLNALREQKRAIATQERMDADSAVDVAT
jgi:tetratricopeptide (TPR) repeat protein